MYNVYSTMKEIMNFEKTIRGAQDLIFGVTAIDRRKRAERAELADFSNIPTVAVAMRDAIRALETLGDGAVVSDPTIERVIKIEPVNLFETSENSRYAIERTLKTYVGVKETVNGWELIQESGQYGEKKLASGDVIAVNRNKQLRYPDGTFVLGYYDETGTAHIVSKMEDAPEEFRASVRELPNEYVFKKDYAQTMYGFNPKDPKDKEYLAKTPRYAIRLPKRLPQNATMTQFDGDKMSIYGGGMIVFTLKSNEEGAETPYVVKERNGLGPNQLDTYQPLAKDEDASVTSGARRRDERAEKAARQIEDDRKIFVATGAFIAAMAIVAAATRPTESAHRFSVELAESSNHILRTTRSESGSGVGAIKHLERLIQAGLADPSLQESYPSFFAPLKEGETLNQRAEERARATGMYIPNEGSALFSGGDGRGTGDYVTFDPETGVTVIQTDGSRVVMDSRGAPQRYDGAMLRERPNTQD